MNNNPAVVPQQTMRLSNTAAAPTTGLLPKLLCLTFLPLNQDLALLLLRVWLGASLFVVHGYEKLSTFSQMVQGFPDPLHLGQTSSLVAALLADAVCSLLLIAGLFTRLCALYVVSSIGVAFLWVWHASFLNIMGEVAYLYVGGYLAIVLAGPGKYSVDYQWQPQQRVGR